MEFKYLNTFRTIVETGSFTAAAEKLNYTQSTITFQIGQLEQELSVKLFEKIGRRMVLTKAGDHLIPYVDEVMRSMNCYDIRNELLSGALDLGLLYEEAGGFNGNLVTDSFGKYPLVLVAAPEIQKVCPDFITPDQAIPVPFIINEPLCVFRLMFEDYLRQKRITLDHTIELWSIPTIKNLVMNEVGVSFLPEFTVQKELESRELVKIPTDIPNPQVSAVLAHHKNKWISPLMQCFMDLCGASGRA